MRNVSRLASIFPLPLFCFTARAAFEFSGAVAAGVLAGAILVALMALALEGTLAGIQWAMTSKGLKLKRS